MNGIHQSVLPVVIPPAEADENKTLDGGRSGLSGVRFEPALQNLLFQIHATDVPPASPLVGLGSFGVVSSPLSTGKKHLPEHGPTGNTMPFYDQGDSNGCGTTSLSMILKYFGIDVPREVIDQAIRRAETSLGSGPGDLIEFARDHGLEAEGYNNGTWEEVKSMIDQGYPVMPSIANDSGGRHLIVITGYETRADGKEYVLYHDPELGDENGVPGHEQSMSVDDFKKKWGEETFGVKNYFMAFAPKGTDLPAGRDKGAEGALGVHAGAANVVNGFDRIFSPDCFGSFIHGIPEFVGGLFQTVGCGIGALFQAGASWLGNAVEGVPVLENFVQPFTDLVSGFGAGVADVFNGFGEAFDSVGGAFESLFDGDVGGFIEGVGDAVGDVAGGVVDAVGDVADAVGDAVSDFFSGW